MVWRQRALELLEEVVEDVSALVRVVLVLSRCCVSSASLTVEATSARKSRNRNTRAAGPTTHVRMNRVTHLMYEREDVIKLALKFMRMTGCMP